MRKNSPLFPWNSMEADSIKMVLIKYNSNGKNPVFEVLGQDQWIQEGEEWKQPKPLIWLENWELPWVKGRPRKLPE